jgi:hypothetical protein
MRQTLDTVWQRRGTSWIWDERARNLIATASTIWSLRQFLQAVGHWPDDLPSNDNQTLVVGGLEGCLDLLAPDEAEAWLGDTIKSAIVSFQDAYAGEAALIFWLPLGHSRLRVQATTDAVTWLCEAPYRDSQIDFSRILWGEANEYPQEILLRGHSKPVGLFHVRIT